MSVTPDLPGTPLPPEALAALEEGIRLHGQGDAEGAHRHFERAHRRAPGHPRVQSWYGLTLVTVEKNSNLGVALVDRAVRHGHVEPELALNQARVALALGQRFRAVTALERGMAANPGSEVLAGARLALGTRQRPVVPFLSRGNPVNRLLGRLAHRWRQRGARPGGPTPAGRQG